MKKATILILCLVIGCFMGISAAVAQDGEVLDESSVNQALTCTIYNEAGSPITTANAGDVVQLHIAHPSITNPTRNFIFAVPSNDSSYKDVFLYVKKYTGTSSGGFTYMKINPYIYIHGTGVFIGIVPGYGQCFAVLNIP